MRKETRKGEAVREKMMKNCMDSSGEEVEGEGKVLDAKSEDEKMKR